VGSFPRADAPFDPPLPEVALLGRSNVGKSTLLNAVLGRKLAKVSSSPGKTRMMNVFRMPDFYFLDLPGYGYARVSKTERVGFRHLLANVLERPRLAGAVWLLDVRHEPSADDRDMQELLAADGVRVLAALTKADKLPRGQRVTRARELQEMLHLDDEQVVLTSAQTGDGIGELKDAIGDLIRKATE
jgi:GTP-binding protein